MIRQATRTYPVNRIRRVAEGVAKGAVPFDRAVRMASISHGGINSDQLEAFRRLDHAGTPADVENLLVG